MSESLEGGDSKPNLVPILDMVFQLITFFMLVINFKAASLDLNLKLPVIGSARPVETGGQKALLILNIRVVDRDGTREVALTTYGQPRFDVESYIAGEAQADRLKLGRGAVPSDDEADIELPTTVVIRADHTTPFKLLYRVVKACQDYGYRQFALRASQRVN